MDVATDEEFLTGLTTLLGYLIAITAVAAAVAVTYIVWIYRKSARSSLMFRMLVRADVLKIVAGAWFAAIVVYWVRNPGAALPEWMRVVSAVAIEVLLLPPILHAVTVWRLRHKRGDSSPPPWDAAADE